MTEKKEQIISQFNMAEMPSLPELLLREMDALFQPDAGAQMAGHRLSNLQTLATKDLFLYAKLLALLPGQIIQTIKTKMEIIMSRVIKGGSKNSGTEFTVLPPVSPDLADGELQ